MGRGALWNTFVFTARAEALWDMAQRAVPALHETFSLVRFMLGSRHAPTYIDHVYKTMPVVNFSSDILAPLSKSLRVLPVPEVGWSDWGNVERIYISLKRIGKLDQLVERLRLCKVDPETLKALARFSERPPPKGTRPKSYRPYLQVTG
jgi:hypothetical protein